MEKGQGGGDPSYKYGKCLYTLHMAEINRNSSHNIIFTIIICSKLMKVLVQKSHFCLKYVTFFFSQFKLVMCVAFYAPLFSVTFLNKL